MPFLNKYHHINISAINGGWELIIQALTLYDMRSNYHKVNKLTALYLPRHAARIPVCVHGLAKDVSC